MFLLTHRGWKKQTCGLIQIMWGNMLKGEVHFIYDTNLNTSFNENEKALQRTKENKHELWTWTKQKEIKSFANKVQVDDSKFQEQTSPQEIKPLQNTHLDHEDFCKQV